MKILVSIAIAVIGAGILCSGCYKRHIPNTEIEDTEANREIVAFCERYRRAVEDLNIGLLLSLASPRYFDNMGTSKADDDVDREGLEKVLKERFNSVKKVRYEIRYRSLYEMHSTVYVEYTYTTSFQYEVGEKARWGNKTADNRLEIERSDGGYLIVSGM